MMKKFFLLVAAAVVCTAFAKPVTLVKDGKASAVIVISDNAGDVAKNAA